MIELFVILALIVVALVVFSVFGAVFHIFGQLLGAAFSVLGWLISLPFVIFGWLVSAIAFLFAGPVLLFALLVPVTFGLLAIGIVLLAFLAPAILVGGGLWLALRALPAPREPAGGLRPSPGGFFQGAPGAIRPEGTNAVAALEDPRLPWSVLRRLALMALLSLAFWHAPALVCWGRMPVNKALFASIVAC